MLFGFLYDALPLVGAYEIVVINEFVGGTVKAEAQQRHGGKHDDDKLKNLAAYGFLALQMWQIGSRKGQ